VPSQTLSSNYFSESTSSLYLTGQGDRGYFDLRSYHFLGLSSHDFQPQQPHAHPVWDYNKTFDIDPARTLGIGGEAELDVNLLNLSARAASYQSVGFRLFDNAFNLYDVCAKYVPGTTNGSCLLRGIGGDFTRATAQVSWKRKYIDPIGEVWTPFAFARFNGEWLNLDTSRSYTFTSAAGTSTFSNGSQTAFTGGASNTFFGEVMPGAGLEYRYPFLAKTFFGSVVFEPIAQIIARPDDQLGSRSLVNLDAQSLVFDDSTLFQWNKYSGYDRFETGIRANYGAQLTTNFKNGGYINVIAGQSYQLAGRNTYATPDAANVGLSSGLDTRRSDYVTALSFAPTSMLSFTAKTRYDEQSFEPRRVDLVASANFGALTSNVQYARYEAQPLIGYAVRREGLSLNSRYKINENYFMQGNVVFDMSRHLYPASLIGNTNPGLFAPALYGIGAGYQDDCTTFSVNYTSVYQDNGSGSLVRNQTLLLQLQLRTLGDAKFSQTFTSNTSELDGVKTK
jgi:LPS-assembly protein